MKMKELNVQAMDEALVAVVGLKKSKIITDVFSAIDRAEKRGQSAGFAEGEETAEAKLDNVFADGWTKGYCDGNKKQPDLPDYPF